MTIKSFSTERKTAAEYLDQLHDMAHGVQAARDEVSAELARLKNEEEALDKVALQLRLTVEHLAPVTSRSSILDGIIKTPPKVAK